MDPIATFTTAVAAMLLVALALGTLMVIACLLISLWVGGCSSDPSEWRGQWEDDPKHPGNQHE